MKHQPLPLRPREKLAELGIHALTTAELITLILGSGSKEFPVHTLSRKIEKVLEKQKSLKLEHLTSIAGVGHAKASQLLAVLELAERLRPDIKAEKLDSVEKVLLHLHELRIAEKEHVIGLYLDARMKLIHKEVLSVGGLNQAVILARDVFAPIKHHPVLSIILAHNHPSQDAEPSLDDLELTERLVNAGEILGVEVLDHIIITKTTHYSFKQHGKMSH